MMKLKKVFMLIPLAGVLIGSSLQGWCQSSVLEVTYNKTTSLVFPEGITSVDRGSRDLLAQKAKGVENVLQVKAARADFPETNLTVITSDGTIREFTVRYVRHPVELVKQICFVDSVRNIPLMFPSRMTEAGIREISERVLEKKRNVRFVRDRAFKCEISLRGIYINDDVIFYHVHLENRSSIDYDVDFVRFYVQDLKRVKRTASQEVDIMPLFVYGDGTLVEGNSSCDVVYAMGKFTIPDAKHLVMEVFEKNGGRHLELSIRNKTILGAEPVN